MIHTLKKQIDEEGNAYYQVGLAGVDGFVEMFEVELLDDAIQLVCVLNGGKQLSTDVLGSVTNGMLPDRLMGPDSVDERERRSQRYAAKKGRAGPEIVTS
jgi:hypothetical protein